MWRATICLVPGLPIIMCQLNLTTIHYSGLRTRVQAPYFCYLPLSTDSTPLTAFTVPLLHSHCYTGIEACTLATTSQVEIQLPFNIVRMCLKSNCLLQNSTRSGWKTAEDSCQQINVPSVYTFFLTYIVVRTVLSSMTSSFSLYRFHIPTQFNRIKCHSSFQMELERGSRLRSYTIRLKCT